MNFTVSFKAVYLLCSLSLPFSAFSAQTLSIYSNQIALNYNTIPVVSGLSLYSDILDFDYRFEIQKPGLALFSEIISMDFMVSDVSFSTVPIFLDYKPPEFLNFRINTPIYSNGTGQIIVQWDQLDEVSWAPNNNVQSGFGLQSSLLLSSTYNDIMDQFSPDSALLSNDLDQFFSGSSSGMSWNATLVNPGHWFTQFYLSDSYSNLFSSTLVEFDVPEPIRLASGPLHPAIFGHSYLYDFSYTGGNGPYTAKVTEGLPPGGIDFFGTSNSLSGSPNETGNYGFSIEVIDSTTPSLIKTISLQIEVLNSDEIASQSLMIPVSEGWNLISLPSNHKSMRITELLGESLKKVFVAWKLKNGSWSIFPPPDTPAAHRNKLSAYSIFTDMEAGEGLFILVKPGEGFNIALPEVPQKFVQQKFEAGLSLIGVQQTMHAETFLTNYSKTTIWTYENSNWKVSHRSLSISELQSIYGPSIGTLDTLKPGIGYIIQ
ncbi:hypothetical protein HOF92_11955 [bacterium]|nr:hypothetical protein [bacterium]